MWIRKCFYKCHKKKDCESGYNLVNTLRVKGMVATRGKIVFSGIYRPNVLMGDLGNVSNYFTQFS